MADQESSGFLRKIEWEADVPFRWVLLALGALVVKPLIAWQTSAGLLGGLILYMLSSVALMLFFARPRRQLSLVRSALVYSYVTDVVFVSFLVYYTGGISSDMYLLYCLLAFKAAFYYPYLHSIIFIAFVFCPLYIYVLYLGSQSLFFVLERTFLLRYFLLVAAVLVGLYVAWHMDARQKRIRALYASLVEEKKVTDARLRQITAVSEVAKALVSIVDIERATQLVLDALASIFDIGRCLVALVDEEQRELVGRFGRGIDRDEIGKLRVSLDGSDDVLAWASQRQYPIAVVDDPAFHRAAPWASIRPFPEDVPYVSAPLITRDQLMGLVYLETPTEELTDEQLDLVTSFTHLVALALENAQLYQRVDEKRKELEAVLKSIGDGVIVVDAQCSLIMINPVASEMFAVPASNVLGQPVTAIVDNEALVSLLREAMEGDREASFVRQVGLYSTGRARESTYEALASPLSGARDGRRGAVVVLRDITKQKELEAMKSNFVSIVSHELKTPLHSIKGFVDVILMGKTGEISELQRDFLETARDQANHLQDVIEDLLDYTQFESGRIDLTLEQISLAGLVDEIIAKLEPLAETAQVALHSHIASAPLHLYADRTRLLQVLSNLIDNAIKFTPAGGAITVEALDADQEVQVRVADTGIGIPPSERERVFERFYQVDSSTTRRYQGTGLGLAICRSIIEAHEGRIWVEGNEPEGSVFCFILPKHLEEREGLAVDFFVVEP